MTTNSHISNNLLRKSSRGLTAIGLGVAILAALGSTPAQAKAAEDSSSVGAKAQATPARARVVADNVVITPGNQQPQPAQQAQPAQQVVVPQATAPAPTSTVVEPARHTNVEVSSPHNYMTTIAVSALMGALTGGLIGGAIYYLGDRQNGIRVAYWAAGGVLVGTGVGIAQVMVQESRVSAATASRFPSDPAPTYRLALLNVKF